MVKNNTPDKELMPKAPQGANKRTSEETLESLQARYGKNDAAPAENAVNANRAFADGYTLGLNLVISVLIGMGMGYGLDRLFGTTPWLMLVLLIAGFAAGLREIWLNLFQKERS